MEATLRKLVVRHKDGQLEGIYVDDSDWDMEQALAWRYGSCACYKRVGERWVYTSTLYSTRVDWAPRLRWEGLRGG